MRWFAVHHELSTHPKWLDLAMDERGAWISLLTIAADQDERGTLRDRATAEILLRREMHVVSRPAADLVATLIGSGLIDEDEESGLLTFHDFDEWQLRTKKPSDWPEPIRLRVEKHRRKKKEKQKEERDIDGEGEVTPSNALPSCPACGAPLRVIDGSRGRFYGCSNHPTCSWKANQPPTAKPPPFTADLESIAAAHGGELPRWMKS